MDIPPFFSAFDASNSIHSPLDCNHVIKKSPDKLDRVVTQDHTDREERDSSYRGMALKMHPWACGRCAREFSHENLRELTIHHRDHNHDSNPSDGSNWELVCIYCHDNEHSRYIDSEYAGTSTTEAPKIATTHNPVADLSVSLKKRVVIVGSGFRGKRKACKPALPHQTMHTVIPYAAFRHSSCQRIRQAIELAKTAFSDETLKPVPNVVFRQVSSAFVKNAD